ncbi:MAG: carbamate kinase [Gaiellaceae bacterium]
MTPPAPEGRETTTVIALGGNALTRPGERGTAAEQRANLRRTAEALRPLLAEGELVVTHGNGPQVGNELLRQERAAEEVPPLPLWLAVAQTQAEIGALIEAELAPVAGRAVACLLTHVRVDGADPAFGHPTKPIGPFYSEARAKELERERGWVVTHDAGRGWRRVVPSPLPLEVIEIDAVRALVAAGAIAVACGGGGIPVAVENGRLAGIDAVIDKDRASALLAVELGAERLLLLTDVPGVYRAYGTPEQEEVRELSAAEADALLPELAEGSIRPKVEAAADFARRTGGEALITSADVLAEALSGQAGTRVIA